MPLTHARGGGARAEQQAERGEHERLARARFAAEHVQAGGQVDGYVVQKRKALDFQALQHVLRHTAPMFSAPGSGRSRADIVGPSVGQVRAHALLIEVNGRSAPSRVAASGAPKARPSSAAATPKG